MAKPVPLNSIHKKKIIGEIKNGVSKQQVLDDFFPLVSNKQKLVQFIAQVPSANMRARYSAMNYTLAAIIGLMFLLNLISGNVITAGISGVLLYLVVTYQTYHYHWISVLSLFAMIPIVFILITTIIYSASSDKLTMLSISLLLAIVTLTFGIILNTRLSTKFTARYVEKEGPNGRYKTFEYIFKEEEQYLR